MKIDVSMNRRGHSGFASLIVLAAFVLLFKGLKVGRAYLAWYDAWLVYGLAVCAVAAAVLVVCLFLRAASRRFTRGRAGVWKYAIIAVGTAVVVLEIVVGLATGSIEFLSVRLVGVYAWDLFMLLFLLTAYVGIAARYLVAANVAAVVISTVLLVAYALEAGYFLRTGVVGDWLLLRFLIDNYDVVAAVAEDVDFARTLLVVAPVGILVVVVVVTTLRRNRISRLPRALFRSCASATVVMLVVGLVFPTRLLPPSYQVHSASLGLRLVADVFRSTGAPDGRGPGDFDLPYFSENVALERLGGGKVSNVVIVLLESGRARSTPPENLDGLWMPFLDSLTKTSIVVPRMYTTIPYTTDALLAIFGGVVPPFSTTSRYDRVVTVGWPGLLAREGYETGFVTTSYLNDKRHEREMLRRLGFEMIAGAQDLGAAVALVSNYSGLDDDMLIDTSLAWIDSVRQRGRPFVLACLTQSSHHPYAVPPTFETRPAAVADRELSMYLNTLAYTDTVVRKLYRGIASRDLLGSTLFVFVGDHGESFGEKGERFHGMSVWEEAVRVPFVIHSADLARDGLGSRVDAAFQQIDVFPTVIQALGFEITGPHHAGRSVLSGRGREDVYIGSAGSRAMALVRDSLKFVYHYRRRPTQVFDLRNDPDEKHDISAVVGDSVVTAVERELQAWQIAANDRVSR